MSHNEKVAGPVQPESYAGSCVVCRRGTDTGINVEGELEWLAAYLVVLGVPTRQAMATVDAARVPVDDEGRAQATFRVCKGCVDAASENKAHPLPEPSLLVADGVITTVTQPGVWN